MKATQQEAFYFHTDASAFGGVLRQPLQRIVATPASASLPQAGGFASREARRFRLDGLISFESARVVVSGYEDTESRSIRTIATATVEGLNILEVFTADRIVAQLSVMHPLDRGPAEISFNGSQYVNLRVNGAAVKTGIDQRFFNVPRVDTPREPNARTQHAPHFIDLIDTAEAQYHEEAEVRRQLVDELGPHFERANPRTDLDEKGSALCSLVQKTQMDSAPEQYGHMIHLPDYGNIFLGQLLVTRTSAQLSMLRLELGCIADGTLSAADTFSNGRFMP